MRLVVFGLFIIVVSAAVLSIRGSTTDGGDPTQFSTTLVLAAAVGVQRLNGVQKWLSAPTDATQINAERLAQQTLIRLCDDRPIAENLLGIRIHIWRVPPWYRRAFPYWARMKMRDAVKWRGLTWLAWFKIRPKLQRLVAVSLVKEPPSGVPFRMGKGLIGVCLLANDRSQTLKLRTSDPEYKAALNSKTEKEWEAKGPEVTHNLSLEDARKLAGLYGQVIAKVIIHHKTAEPIGVVTISVNNSTPRIGTQTLYLSNLRGLALNAGYFI